MCKPERGKTQYRLQKQYSGIASRRVIFLFQKKETTATESSSSLSLLLRELTGLLFFDLFTWRERRAYENSRATRRKKGLSISLSCLKFSSFSLSLSLVFASISRLRPRLLALLFFAPDLHTMGCCYCCYFPLWPLCLSIYTAIYWQRLPEEADVTRGAVQRDFYGVFRGPAPLLWVSLLFTGARGETPLSAPSFSLRFIDLYCLGMR